MTSFWRKYGGAGEKFARTNCLVRNSTRRFVFALPLLLLIGAARARADIAPSPEELRKAADEESKTCAAGEQKVECSDWPPNYHPGVPSCSVYKGDPKYYELANALKRTFFCRRAAGAPAPPAAPAAPPVEHNPFASYMLVAVAAGLVVLGAAGSLLRRRLRREPPK